MNEIVTPRTWNCFPCCSLSNTKEQNTSQQWGIHVQAAANTDVPPTPSVECPVSTQPGERFVTAVDAVTNLPAAGMSAKVVGGRQGPTAMAAGSCEDIIGNRSVGNVNILATVGIRPDSFEKDFRQRCQDSFLELAGKDAGAVKQRFELNYGRDNLQDFKYYAAVNFILNEYIKRHDDVSPEGVRRYNKIQKTFADVLKKDPLNRKSIFSYARKPKDWDKLEHISFSIKQCIELLFNKNDFGPGDFMLQELVFDFILSYRFPKDIDKFSQIQNRKVILKFFVSPYLDVFNKQRESYITKYNKTNNKAYIENIAQDILYISDYVDLFVLTKIYVDGRLAKDSFDLILEMDQSVNGMPSVP